VSQARLGAPADAVWQDRRTRVQRAIDNAAADDARALGREYLDVLTAYQSDAARAGQAFVEIENTMLFATVGQRSE
jgi:hypothetical protein